MILDIKYKELRGKVTIGMLMMMFSNLDTIVFPKRYRDSGTVSARRLFTHFYLNDDFGGGFTQFRVVPKDIY